MSYFGSQAHSRDSRRGSCQYLEGEEREPGHSRDRVSGFQDRLSLHCGENETALATEEEEEEGSSHELGMDFREGLPESQGVGLSS